MAISAILSNRLYVPRECVSSYMLDKFRYILPTENEAEPVVIETFREYEKYVGFSRGNLGKIHEIFGDFDIIDQRPIVPFSSRLQWDPNKRLRNMHDDGSDQQEVVADWLQYGYGQIKAPARWGKTITMANIICKLKVKTLIIAHQIELLNQMLKTFWNFTNLKDLQKPGKFGTEWDDEYINDLEVVGHAWKWEDIEKQDVTVLTYQSFVTGKDGDQWLLKYRDAFGAVFVDEVFKLGATCYSRTINSINSYFRLGVSATPFRKDELHCIVEDVIGPVVVEGHTEQLRGDWIDVQTGFDPGTFFMWPTLTRKLMNNADRNQLIIDCVVKDIAAGHSIVIATDRRDHTEWLAELINNYGIKAEAFNGGSYDRKGLLTRAISGTTKVVISMRKMLLGIDVPRWSCYYSVMPIGNEYNFYQEMSRIRTPFRDADGNSLKPRPLVRLFVDNAGFMKGMLYNCCHKVLRQEGFTKIKEAGVQRVATPEKQKPTKGYGEVQHMRKRCGNCSFYKTCVTEYKVKTTNKACDEWDPEAI